METEDQEAVEQALIYDPLQTLIIRAWDDPGEENWMLWLDDLQEERAGNNPLWLPIEQFEGYLMTSFYAEDERVEHWPHSMVFAQYLALARRRGWKRATSAEYESIFAPNLSVWDALKRVIENVEPFRTELRALREGLYEDELAKVMALHPWRPTVPLKTLFDSF